MFFTGDKVVVVTIKNSQQRGFATSAMKESVNDGKIYIVERHKDADYVCLSNGYAYDLADLALAHNITNPYKNLVEKEPQLFNINQLL